jgi:DNA-binding NarL/FixJ family response regulator
MSALPTSSTAASLWPPIEVLVVDDQAAVREGVARLISCGTLPLRGVLTAASTEEVLACLSRSTPDVVVLDVDLDGRDGLALMARFAPSTRVLVLTSHGDPHTRARARELGAHGFVEKHEPASALLASLKDVAFPSTFTPAAPMQAGQESYPRKGSSSDGGPDRSF